MKTNNNIPTDEQIAEYLSGTADESTNFKVKQYLEENNDSVDDMLTIVMASVVQNKHSSKKKRTVIKMNPFQWATAASVALVLLTGALMILRNTDNNPVIIASTKPKIQETPYNDINTNESWKTDIPSPTISPKRFDIIKTSPLRQEEHISASESTTTVPSITILYPRRKHEAVIANNGITFRWQSDSPSLTITILDNKGVELVQTVLPNNGSYSIPAQKLQHTDEIKWIISAGNGTSQSGTITIVPE